MHHRDLAVIFTLALILLIGWSPATAKIVVEPGPSEIPPDAIIVDDERIVPLWQVSPKQLLTCYLLIYCPALAVPIKFLYSFGILAILGYRLASRDRPSENPNRRQIFACIRGNPGISASEIADTTGISRGTVNYHLFSLQRKSLVHKNQQGNTIGYFAYTEDLDTTEEHLLMHLKNRTKKSLLSLLMKKPSVSQSEAAGAVEVSRPTVAWHMERLVRDGLVESRKDGRTVRYRLTHDAGEMLGKERKEGTEEETTDAGSAAA